MNKFILVFIVIFIMQSGFAQSEHYPCFMTGGNLGPFSQSKTVYNCSFLGIHYNLMNMDGKNTKYSLLENYPNHFAEDDPFAEQETISLSIIIFWQTLNCNLISCWNNTPIYDQTCNLQFLTAFTNWPGAIHSNSSQLSMYGISEGLSAVENNSSQRLMHYEKPVFNASSLYKERVTSEIMKKLKRNEFDFSGLLQEIIRPSTLPFQ